MSVQEQITRLSGAKNDIASAITEQGVSVPSGTKLDGMAALIAQIVGGEDLDAELTEQDTLLAQIIAALAKKGAVAGEVATLDEVKAYLNI